MKEILIIIVTYNPRLDELENNILATKSDMATTIVVDNSEDKAIILDLKNLIFKLNSKFKVELVQFEENKGIGFAQNYGLKVALENGFKYILELDQDTHINNDYLDKIKSAYLNIQMDDPRILGVGPIAINSQKGSPYYNFKLNQGILKVDYTLSSGFFYHIDVINKIGFKKSDFFLDMVDWEWFIRGKNLFYNTYVSTDVQINHQIGNYHLKFFGLEIGNPAPFRHYYAFRNLLYLVKSNQMPLKWNLKIVFLLIAKLIFYPFLLKDGLLRLKFMWKGFFDFLLCKKGKM